LALEFKKNVTDFLFLDGLCRDVPFGDMHPMEAGMKVNFIFYTSHVDPDFGRIQIRMILSDPEPKRSKYNFHVVPVILEF